MSSSYFSRDMIMFFPRFLLAVPATYFDIVTNIYCEFFVRINKAVAEKDCDEFTGTCFNVRSIEQVMRLLYAICLYFFYNKNFSQTQ